ncbi:unnamed protein product, partial [Mesorhabditis spiculigera]
MSTTIGSLKAVVLKRAGIVVGVGVGAYILRLLFRRWLLAIRAGAACQEPSTEAITTFVKQPPLATFRPLDDVASSSEHEVARSLQYCQGMVSELTKAIQSFAGQDREKDELLRSILARVRILETDLAQIVPNAPAGYACEALSIDSHFHGVTRGRSGSLSVLSDDSFMSALEDINVADQDWEKKYDVNKNELILYQTGLKLAKDGKIHIRQNRFEDCHCDSPDDFAAKVYCIRKALKIVTADERKVMRLVSAGRQLLGDLLSSCGQDPAAFYRAYDKMVTFLEDEDNCKDAEDELKTRNVHELGLWDVLMDFVLLDAFDELKNPPSSVYSVTRNSWLSESMKYSTISTVIWSLLKAKRQRLVQSAGFIAHFYDISETVSPALTLGLLGTNQERKELCHYFKEQIAQLVCEIFNEERVRFGDEVELAEDIWTVIESRAETMVSRLSQR